MTRGAWRGAAAVIALASAVACNGDNLNMPNFNSPTVQGLSSDPAGLQLAATGILITQRNNQGGYYRDVAVFGREGYDYFPTDARTVSNYLIGQKVGGVTRLDPGGFASGNWTVWYGNMRNEVNFIKASSGSPVLTSGQKAAAKGFAETFRALNLWYIVVTRDSLGAPVELPDDVNQPAPFVTRDSALKFVSAMLDAGAADLQTGASGGDDFGFNLTSGFASFSKPSTFIKFNRALAARVLNDRGSKGCGATCYQAALTALQASFITTPTSPADLAIGAYDVFSSSPGDALNLLNPLVDPNTYAHKEFADSAQSQPGGAPDLRVAKVKALAQPVAAPGGFGIAATYALNEYATTTSPMPIIRNEELLLIRAEAEQQTGAGPAALADINTVRQISGGLAPLASLGADPIGTILKERWYSLLFEGHRWNDYRRFGRLAALPLDFDGTVTADNPKGQTHFVAKVMPIPTAECLARKSAPPAGC